jgi:hypothetical protein
VDNGSQDGSQELLEGLGYPNYRYLRLPLNLGYGGGMNAGFQVARGEFLCVMNSDLESLPGAIDKMLARMKQDEQIGILGPRLEFPDGRLQVNTANELTLFALFLQMTYLERLFGGYFRHNWNHSSEQFVPQISGACWLIRRALVEKLGGFDPNYFMYCEDTDFTRRARSFGYEVLYYPEARFIHHLGGSSCENRWQMVAQYHRSLRHYFGKFNGVWGAAVARILVTLGSVLRIVSRLPLLLLPTQFERSLQQIVLHWRVLLTDLGLKQLG